MQWFWGVVIKRIPNLIWEIVHKINFYLFSFTLTFQIFYIIASATLSSRDIGSVYTFLTGKLLPDSIPGRGGPWEERKGGMDEEMRRSSVTTVFLS